ncbi:MAG: KilA-N domain-containing protein [Ignavibacteriaceae bacterium]|nr:KilA-N domain-containing protein [Ignavibacteriaceae bacterium]
MVKSKTINVKGTEIIISNICENDYISLTDIARYKDKFHTNDIIKHWMRNSSSIERLGFWELLYNKRKT